jgi:hypothetical protein
MPTIGWPIADHDQKKLASKKQTETLAAAFEGPTEAVKEKHYEISHARKRCVVLSIDYSRGGRTAKEGPMECFV